MKRTIIKTIMLGVAAVLLAATSCAKEETPVAKTCDPISISIQGGIGDFTPADGVKATTESVIRVKWESGDKVYVYDGASYLGDLTVSIKDPKTEVEDARYAYLSGTLTKAPQAGTKLLTLVYGNKDDVDPEIIEGKIYARLGRQIGNDKDDFPFMLYATLPFKEGMTEITNKFVPFEFATSVMKVNCANLVEDAGNITFAGIEGINHTCVLSMSKDAEPTISGVGDNTISRIGAFTTDNGKGTFMVAVAPTAAVSSGNTRYVNIRQGDEAYIGMQLTDAEIKAGSYYNTICFVKSKKPADQDCVYSHGIWWAKENLAITESGKREFNGTGHVNGDYFQWAASYAGYNITADADKKPENLLIYTSFTSTMCGDGSDAFEFKGPETGKKYRFSTSDSGDNIGICPYYDKTGKKYTEYTSGEVNLEKSDDVASIILGGNWRMPTTKEFKAMRDATYWAWDATDCGYYVFIPGQATASWAGGMGPIYDPDKAKAALFFPAAGYGYDSNFFFAGSDGTYWSSSLESSITDFAYYFYFNSSTVNPQDGCSRYLGLSVRPVSD